MTFKKIRFITIFSIGIFFITGCGTQTNYEDNNTKTAENINDGNNGLAQGEFIRNDDLQTVSDIKNNLMWQDNNDTLSIKKAYNADDGDTAINYCKNLSLGGYNDWRLPTKQEMETVMDEKLYPHIAQAFKYKDSIIGGAYWTSTKDYKGCYTINDIWVTDFLYTYKSKNITKLQGACTVETNKHRIRCVR